MGTNRNIFHRTVIQYSRKVNNFSLDYGSWVEYSNTPQSKQHRFFQQIKVRQPIGRKDSIQTVIRTSRRLDSFLYEADQNFEVFFKYSKQIKKSKTFSGWCPFQGLSNGTTHMQGQSGRTVLLKIQKDQKEKKTKWGPFLAAECGEVQFFLYPTLLPQYISKKETCACSQFQILSFFSYSALPTETFFTTVSIEVRGTLQLGKIHQMFSLIFVKEDPEQ